MTVHSSGTVKRLVILLAAGIFCLIALVGCGQSEQAQENVEQTDGQSEENVSGEEVVVGGFQVEGPEGQEIEVPEARVDRDAAEEYLGEVRPVIEDTAQDISRVVEPEARLENQELTLSIEVRSVEEAQQAAQQGLEQLREIQPPEDMQPVHERLIEAYERALPAYNNIVEAFRGDDVSELTEAVRESLPEIERATAQARSILQELQRAERQDAQQAQ